jgi:hypothetical protein
MRASDEQLRLRVCCKSTRLAGTCCRAPLLLQALRLMHTAVHYIRLLTRDSGRHVRLRARGTMASCWRTKTRLDTLLLLQALERTRKAGWHVSTATRATGEHMRLRTCGTRESTG